jgi:hypothetical protein
MITKCPGGFAFLFASAISTSVFGGVIGGGSGPPAKEALEQMLMSHEVGAAAGLFETELGEIKLGVNRSLDSDLVLTRKKLSPQALSISEVDFEALVSSRNRSVDAVTIGGALEPGVRSYIVDDGDKVGELILRDRRELARAAIK